jgi:hypothetical protein
MQNINRDEKHLEHKSQRNMKRILCSIYILCPIHFWGRGHCDLKKTGIKRKSQNYYSMRKIYNLFMHAPTTSYVVRVWLYVLLIVHKFLVGPALPYLSSIFCPCRDNVCSKNTVTVLCSNGADGSISCTFTYATELTIFIHEFMYAMVNNKKKTIVTQFKLYLCSVMLKINKIQFSTARPMNKWE